MVDMSNTPIMSEKVAPGVYFDMPENQYRSAVGVNKSYAWALYNSSKVHMAYGASKGIPQASADRGTAVHKAFLDKEDVVESSNYKTRQSDNFKAEHAEAASRGKILFPTNELEAVEGMIHAVNSEPRFNNFLNLSSTRTEVSLFAWDHKRDMMLKGRADILNIVEGKAGDLKTCTSAKPENFQETCAQFGYFPQAGMYMYICKLLGIEITKFGFFCVENKAPHVCHINYLTTKCEAYEYAMDMTEKMLDAAADDVHSEKLETGWGNSTLLQLPPSLKFKKS